MNGAGKVSEVQLLAEEILAADSRGKESSYFA